MSKIILDIEKASNGSYIVTWYKSSPNAIARLGGTKPEIEHLAFTNATQIIEWINKTV